MFRARVRERLPACPLSPTRIASSTPASGGRIAIGAGAGAARVMRTRR